MKNTLWTYGCSFTADYSPLDNDPPNTYDLYKKWRGGTLPDVWPTILGQLMNMNVQNKGEGATGNDKIFMQFCDSSDSINRGDIVIIGWTSILRYMMAGIDNKLLVNILPNELYKQYDKNTIETVLINRNFTIWYSQIVSYIKIIINYCNLIGARVYFWTSDLDMFKYIEKHINPNHHNKFMHKGYRNIFECLSDTYQNLQNNFTIFFETDKKIVDYHLGELGHKLQAEIIYYHILKGENDI